MIDPQAEAVKRLMALAKSGAQRTPLVPRVSSDPDSPPVGLLWIREDEQKAYLKTSDDTTLLVASAAPTEGGTLVTDRSISHEKLMLNTITSDELATDSVTEAELAPGAVDGSALATILDAVSSVSFYASTPASPALELDVDFDHATDVFRVLRDGVQRFRVDETHVSIGADLPGSAFSVQTGSADTALRIRGAGGAILAEKTNGQLLFSVDASGNATFGGSISSLSGSSGTAGSLAVQGALTVTNQGNFLSGMQVAERVDFLDELHVNGQTFFESEIFLPESYSAKVGQAVHLRTLVAEENRLILEGVDAVGEAEIQLGTGGPVLRGSFAQSDRMFIGADRIVTSAASGILGNQLATDTITGATGPGTGNIAAETVTGYNIKNASITSTELSPGAVVTAALASGAVTDVQLADGSVIDRVVASMGVGKLISGTLNADEIFMGPSGHIYLGPTFSSEILDERIQIDASGIRAYNSFNTPLAEFTPGGFTLRTGVDGARLEFDAATGLELFGLTGERTGYLSPLGEFQLDSAIDGARMTLNSGEGVQFYAGETKNLAYNPGFIDGSEHELANAGEATDDQVHVFAGEYAVKFRSTNSNINAPSYVDVPFKNTVGTGSSVTRSRVNWCVNPSVETVSTGWLASAQTGQNGAFGAALGFIRDRAVWAIATGAGAASISAPIATTTGELQWALSCSVRVSTAQNVTVEVVWYDVNSAVILTDVSTPFALQTNVVRQIGLVAESPSNATSFRLRVVASLQITDKLEVSNVLYERASGIDSYFDGYTEGYQWDGTPGNSASSLIPVPVLDSPNNLVSIFVWSDVPAWAQIEGRDSTSGLSRGVSSATELIPNQWSRVQVQCVGKMDKVRLHYPSSDPARQTRITATPVWWSGLQVEADRDIATPFCSGGEPGCRWEGLEAKSASLRDRDVVVTQISPTLGTTVSGAIVGGSLTSASFFAGRIFGTEITGVNITGSVLTGNLINGDQILAGTIQGTSLSARTIDAGSIVVGTLTGTEISAGSVNGDRITAGTLTATQIGARQVTADKLQADLILSSKIIAGAAVTGARVEMTAAVGLQAFMASGTRTFFLNAATGSAYFMGQLDTAASGTRIVVNPGGSAPDEIRFYQGTNYAYINAEPAPGGTGAVIGRSQRVSNIIGAFGCYPSEGFVACQNTTISLSAASCLADALNLWGPVMNLDARGSSSSYIEFKRQGTSASRLMYRCLSSEPQLFSPQYDVQLTWTSGRALYVGDTAGLPLDIVAKNVVASSSRTVKKGERVARFGRTTRTGVGTKTALAVVLAVESKQYNYDHELAIGEVVSPAPPRFLRKPRLLPSGHVAVDEVTHQPLEDLEELPPVPVAEVNPHVGPIAEDLLAVAPELVAVNSLVPGGLTYNVNDLLGVLWEAVRELGTRLSALEQRLPPLPLGAQRNP